MVTFGEQFSVSCNKVDAHMAKLMQRDRPAPRNIPMMYPALKGRLLETRGFLQNVQPDEIAGVQSKLDTLVSRPVLPRLPRPRRARGRSVPPEDGRFSTRIRTTVLPVR
jgi:hypothetical protein